MQHKVKGSLRSESIVRTKRVCVSAECSALSRRILQNIDPEQVSWHWLYFLTSQIHIWLFECPDTFHIKSSSRILKKILGHQKLLKHFYKQNINNFYRILSPSHLIYMWFLSKKNWNILKTFLELRIITEKNDKAACTFTLLTVIVMKTLFIRLIRTDSKFRLLTKIDFNVLNALGRGACEKNVHVYCIVCFYKTKVYFSQQSKLGVSLRSFNIYAPNFTT